MFLVLSVVVLGYGWKRLDFDILMFNGISYKTNFPTNRILTGMSYITEWNLEICAPMQAYEESFAAILHVCVEQLAYGTMCHNLFYIGLVVRTIRLTFQS